MRTPTHMVSAAGGAGLSELLLALELLLRFSVFLVGASSVVPIPFTIGEQGNNVNHLPAQWQTRRCGSADSTSCSNLFRISWGVSVRVCPVTIEEEKE